MRAPRKAYILAAGLGTRLRPLTLKTPKPMLPFWGEPLLTRTLAMLEKWGVEEVLINLHHAPGPILRLLATQPFPALRISAIFEPEILGTGGALRNAHWFLDEPFWLLNADVVADLDPAPILRAWSQQKPLAACWLTADTGPRTVRCERGIIRDFHDPAPGQPRATFCGLHLLDSRILPYIAPEGFDTIIAAYRRAQAKRHRIAGVFIPNSFWADIGTPAQYVQAHHDTAQHLGHAGQSFTLPAAAVLTPRERQRTGISDIQPIEVLPPRGSQREFFRVPDGNNSRILIRWSPARPDNRLVARHTRFLENLGIPVPRLLLNLPRAHLIEIEDLGRETLETRLPHLSKENLQQTYQQILDILLRLHTQGLPAARRERLPLMPSFTPALYRWEHDYFAEHILRKKLHLPEAKIAAILAELGTVADILAASPQGLIHRDLQSSNILFRGNNPVLIDYQGMRRGPVAYDIASLLCDPYSDLPAPLQQKLLRAYTTRHPQGEHIAAAFSAGAIQRLCQALGAFANLSQKPGMAHFARHIPTAARQLLRALQTHPKCNCNSVHLWNALHQNPNLQ